MKRKNKKENIRKRVACLIIKIARGIMKRKKELAEEENEDEDWRKERGEEYVNEREGGER